MPSATTSYASIRRPMHSTSWADSSPTPTTTPKPTPPAPSHSFPVRSTPKDPSTRRMPREAVCPNETTRTTPPASHPPPEWHAGPQSRPSKTLASTRTSSAPAPTEPAAGKASPQAKLAVYSAASSRPLRSTPSASRTRTIQPAPYGSEFTASGEASSALLNSSTSPSTGM